MATQFPSGGDLMDIGNHSQQCVSVTDAGHIYYETATDSQYFSQQLYSRSVLDNSVSNLSQHFPESKKTICFISYLVGGNEF